MHFSPGEARSGSTSEHRGKAEMARRYLDAATVYEKLKELGHDYSPAKQQYKQTISGFYTYVYDSHGNPSEIEAPYVEQHVDRGGMFLTEADW